MHLITTAKRLEQCIKKSGNWQTSPSSPFSSVPGITEHIWWLHRGKLRLEQLLLKPPTDSPPQAPWPGRRSCPLQQTVIPPTCHKPEQENSAFLVQIPYPQVKASAISNNIPSCCFTQSFRLRFLIYPNNYQWCSNWKLTQTAPDPEPWLADWKHGYYTDRIILLIPSGLTTELRAPGTGNMHRPHRRLNKGLCRWKVEVKPIWPWRVFILTQRNKV